MFIATSVTTFWPKSVLMCRDTFPVYLTETTDGAAAQQPTRADDEAAERFVCPVTLLPATRYPFVAISSCGHVFSDRAMKQVCMIMSWLAFVADNSCG